MKFLGEGGRENKAKLKNYRTKDLREREREREKEGEREREREREIRVFITFSLL